MIYLTLAELLHVAERALGSPPLVRDAGLAEAALARPRASVFGADAYPTPAGEGRGADALDRAQPRPGRRHKRLALAGAIAFLGVNGYRLTRHIGPRAQVAQGQDRTADLPLFSRAVHPDTTVAQVRHCARRR